MNQFDNWVLFAAGAFAGWVLYEALRPQPPRIERPVTAPEDIYLTAILEEALRARPTSHG